MRRVYDNEFRVPADKDALTVAEVLDTVTKSIFTELDGKVRTLADSFQGKRFNSPNDVAVDQAGRVYVSDPRYQGDEPHPTDEPLAPHGNRVSGEQVVVELFLEPHRPRPIFQLRIEAETVGPSLLKTSHREGDEWAVFHEAYSSPS